MTESNSINEINSTDEKSLKIVSNVLLEVDVYCPPKPGAVARSEACPLSMQVAPSSISTSGRFCHGDLVMKKFLRPFSFFRYLGGLPRNSVVRALT